MIIDVQENHAICSGTTLILGIGDPCAGVISCYPRCFLDPRVGPTRGNCGDAPGARRYFLCLPLRSWYAELMLGLKMRTVCTSQTVVQGRFSIFTPGVIVASSVTTVVALSTSLFCTRTSDDNRKQQQLLSMAGEIYVSLSPTPSRPSPRSNAPHPPHSLLPLPSPSSARQSTGTGVVRLKLTLIEPSVGTLLEPSAGKTRWISQRSDR